MNGGTRQLTMDDMVRATDDAVGSAEVAAQPWSAIALAAIEYVACSWPEWTTDDVWAELDRWGIPRPAEPRALGGPMRRARRAGWMEVVGIRPSRRTTTAAGAVHHSTQIPVYRSLIRVQTLRWPPA